MVLVLHRGWSTQDRTGQVVVRFQDLFLLDLGLLMGLLQGRLLVGHLCIKLRLIDLPQTSNRNGRTTQILDTVRTVLEALIRGNAIR